MQAKGIKTALSRKITQGIPGLLREMNAMTKR